MVPASGLLLKTLWPVDAHHQSFYFITACVHLSTENCSVRFLHRAHAVEQCSTTTGFRLKQPRLHSIKRRAGWSDRKQKSRQILSGHVLETSFAAVGKNKLCSITAKLFSILQRIYISVAVLLGAKSFLTKELKDKRFSASTRIETNKQQVSGTKWLSNSQTVI